MDDKERDLEDARRRNSFDEEEIDLLDLIIPLLKRKRMIFLIVVIAGVAAAAYGFFPRSADVPQEPGIHRSAAVLGNIDDVHGVEAALKGWELSFRLIENHDLLPVLFRDAWDAERTRWITDAPPALLDGHRALQEMLALSGDGDTLTLEFASEVPDLPRNMLGWYIEQLKQREEERRRYALAALQAEREALEAEMAATPHPALREKLAETVANHVVEQVRITGQQGGGFTLLEGPTPTERVSSAGKTAATQDGKAQPKKTVVVLFMVAAFMVAVFLAYLLEFVERLKQRNPEKFAELKRHVKL